MNKDLQKISTDFQHLLLKQETLPCDGWYDQFFPEEVYDSIKKRLMIENAKGLCAVCPIREQCLEFALANNEAYGIWGGLTPSERSAI